jgi:hypothetical protein
MSVITSQFIATVWTSHTESKFVMNHWLIVAFKLITVFKMCCNHILLYDVLVFRKYSDMMVWVVARNRGGEWKDKQCFEWWLETGMGNGKKNHVFILCRTFSCAVQGNWHLTYWAGGFEQWHILCTHLMSICTRY